MNPFNTSRIQVNLPESRTINFFSLLPKTDQKTQPESNEDQQFSKSQKSQSTNPEISKIPHFHQAISDLIQRIEYTDYYANFPDSDSCSSLESLEDFIELSQASQIVSLTQESQEYKKSLTEGFHSILKDSFKDELILNQIIPQENVVNIDTLIKGFIDSARAGLIKNFPVISLEDLVFYLKTWVKIENVKRKDLVFKKISEKTGVSLGIVQELCLKKQGSSKTHILLELKKKILNLKYYLNDLQNSKIKWNKIAENQLVDIENLLESCKNLQVLKEGDTFDVELFKKLHLAEVYQKRSNVKMINFNSNVQRFSCEPIKGVCFDEINEFPIDDFIAFDV
jgi:hypothetical protein